MFHTLEKVLLVKVSLKLGVIGSNGMPHVSSSVSHFLWPSWGSERLNFHVTTWNKRKWLKNTSDHFKPHKWNDQFNRLLVNTWNSILTSLDKATCLWLIIIQYILYRVLTKPSACKQQRSNHQPSSNHLPQETPGKVQQSHQRPHPHEYRPVQADLSIHRRFVFCQKQNVEWISVLLQIVFLCLFLVSVICQWLLLLAFSTFFPVHTILYL